MLIVSAVGWYTRMIISIAAPLSSDAVCAMVIFISLMNCCADGALAEAGATDGVQIRKLMDPD